MWSPEQWDGLGKLLIGVIGALAGAVALILGGRDKQRAEAKEAAPPKPVLDRASLSALGTGLSEYFAAEGLASTGERIALAMEGIAKALVDQQRRALIMFPEEDRQSLREAVRHLESIADDVKKARRDHEP